MARKQHGRGDQQGQNSGRDRDNQQGQDNSKKDRKGKQSPPPPCATPPSTWKITEVGMRVIKTRKWFVDRTSAEAQYVLVRAGEDQNADANAEQKSAKAKDAIERWEAFMRAMLDSKQVSGHEKEYVRYLLKLMDALWKLEDETNPAVYKETFVNGPSPLTSPAPSEKQNAQP